MHLNTKIDDRLHQALNIHRATVGLSLRDVLERALRHYLDYDVADEHVSTCAVEAKGGT